MKVSWLMMAGIAAFQLYRLRSGDRRLRLMTTAVWLLSFGYAGIASFTEWLPLPIWIIRGLFGWADALVRIS